MTTSQMEKRIAESGAFMETFNIEPKGPGILDGLTFAVKDLIDLEGYTTSCGNPSWRETHSVAAVNAVCVDQLLFSGARCIGKTITDELAFSLGGENHFFGTPLNPRAPDRVPGGSSAGSASAVACEVVDFALGTDTGGSVRVPAANCGVFGMRPSYGAISVAGVTPLAPSFDTVGVFARTCDVLSKVVSVLEGCDVASPVQVGTVYFLEDVFAVSDPEVRAGLKDSVELVRKVFAGRTREVSLSDLDRTASSAGLQGWYETYCHVQWPEIWSCHGSWITESRPEFGPRTKVSFDLVKRFDRKATVDAARRREKHYRLLKEFIGKNDLFCIPTMPALAPLRGSLGLDRSVGDYYSRTLSVTAIAGVGRLPQVTLPLASVDGVPIGLSLLASQGMDSFLLSAAQMVVSSAG